MSDKILSDKLPLGWKEAMEKEMRHLEDKTLCKEWMKYEAEDWKFDFGEVVRWVETLMRLPVVGQCDPKRRQKGHSV